MAERVGFLKSGSAEPPEIDAHSITRVESATSALSAFAFGGIGLPSFAGFSSTMSLEMSLDVDLPVRGGLRKDQHRG